MSLQLDGILKPVELADGGFYIEDGQEKSIGNSGRLCKGLMFDLLLGTRAGGMLVQQSCSFGAIVYQDDISDNPDALSLDGLINFGGLYAGYIASLSNGVIYRLSSRLGLYRPDEQFSCLGSQLSTGYFKFDTSVYIRKINDIDTPVIPRVKSEFTLKIPFLGNVHSYLDNLILSYDDIITFEQKVNVTKVHYALGYLKFSDLNKTNVVGVLSNHVMKSYIGNQDTSFPISLINNDSSKGSFVLGSSSYSLSDTIISEKY